MEVVRGRLIFKSFKTLVSELIYYTRGKNYYSLIVDFSNQIYERNFYASREVLKEIKRRVFCDSETNYGLHETLGKLEQKLSNKLDRLYIG